MNRSTNIGVAIIDDHEVIHAGIATWFSQAQSAIRLVGNYTTAEAFLVDNPTPTPELDVILLDLELRSRETDFTPLEAITAAGHRVIIYSHIEHTEVILACLDRGAVTYLAKTEGKTHLLDAIQAAASNEPYVGPRMAAAICSDAQEGRPSLSNKEIQILRAWFQTESKDIVAQRLYLAPSTVKTYLQRVRAKYAAVGRPARTKAALVARAIQDGIININDI